MARSPRHLVALGLWAAGLALATGCRVDVESGAPRSTPSAEDVAAAELVPNPDGPTAPLAFTDPSVLVISPDGAPVALRSGPDLTYAIVAELTDGDAVVPTGVGGASPSGAWVEVTFSSTTGFIPADAVESP